jgi:hypothetical protein
MPEITRKLLIAHYAAVTPGRVFDLIPQQHDTHHFPEILPVFNQTMLQAQNDCQNSQSTNQYTVRGTPPPLDDRLMAV